METLRASEIGERTDIGDWRIIRRTLQASFRTGSMAAGVEFAAKIQAAADEANHHPDMTITYPRVHLLLTTHDADGLTHFDVDMAKTISAIAADMGLEAEPTIVGSVEVGIDALDIPAVMPFWKAVLGYKSDQEDDIVDPYGRRAAFWFQQMDEPRPQRNRMHIDITVPHDVADQRIADAIAAGGTLVSDAAAPAFWVLADPEGNEACICTWQNRD